MKTENSAHGFTEGSEQKDIGVTQSEKVHDHFQTFEACNFPEDYDQENGNYVNRCHSCNFFFRGNKHRVTCKMCDNSEPDWSKLILKKAPDIGGAYAGCWLDGEMTGYARCMVNQVKPLRAENERLKKELEWLEKEYQNKAH